MGVLMRSDFSFKSLIVLWNDDSIFSLLKRDKYVQLYIAFLYKTFDIRDRKEVRNEDFMVYLRKFLKDELLNMQSVGIEGMSPENAYSQMVKYKLIESKAVSTKEGNIKYDVVTNSYKDVVRLIEERTGNTVVGGARRIEDSVNLMLDNVGLISGDIEHRLKYLKEERKKIEKEIAEIEKSGKVRALSKDEIRDNVINIDRNIGEFSNILIKGAMRCKEEQDALNDSFRQRIQAQERVTNGEIASKYFDNLLEMKNSPTAVALKNAVDLMSNTRYKEKMNYIINTMYANKDAVEVMRKEGIDLRKRYKQILRYFQDCSNQIGLTFRSIDMFYRSREVKQNRLLYKKSDELLLACQQYGFKHPTKVKRFLYRVQKLSIICPFKRVARVLKQKTKIVNKERIVSVPDVEQKAFRNIAMANIRGKFESLLDRHKGIFTLKEYVDEEHTYFGMYEFIAVKNIMSRYMGAEMVVRCENSQKESFKITDFAPDSGVYKERMVLASNFEFNEGGYRLWKKDGFRM